MLKKEKGKIWTKMTKLGQNEKKAVEKKSLQKKKKIN